MTLGVGPVPASGVEVLLRVMSSMTVARIHSWCSGAAIMPATRKNNTERHILETKINLG
jgi:hypothetical protein